MSILQVGVYGCQWGDCRGTKNENKIHIIDFQSAQGIQWITLLEAFTARHGGPPHVGITGIDDALSEYARGEVLEGIFNFLPHLEMPLLQKGPLRGFLQFCHS
jgi:hypothetical protein